MWIDFRLIAWLVSVGIALSVVMASAASLIPERARPHLPVLTGAFSEHWPDAPMRYIAAGQIEQESAWREKATLKTSRELGRGLVQMTIAYRGDGSERFNIYRAAVKYRALAGWDWRSDPYNVRYQLTFLVLQDRGNYRQMRRLFRDDTETWRGALVAYNAGPGRVLNRRAQALARGLPADRWEGGLDRAYGKGEEILLYGRPLHEAVNEYPRVIFRRAEKYRRHL